MYSIMTYTIVKPCCSLPQQHGRYTGVHPSAMLQPSSAARARILAPCCCQCWANKSMNSLDSLFTLSQDMHFSLNVFAMSSLYCLPSITFVHFAFPFCLLTSLQSFLLFIFLNVSIILAHICLCSFCLHSLIFNF